MYKWHSNALLRRLAEYVRKLNKLLMFINDTVQHYIDMNKLKGIASPCV